MKEAAEAEVAGEAVRAYIEDYKKRLRERRDRSVWRRLFPWKIVLIKLEN